MNLLPKPWMTPVFYLSCLRSSDGDFRRQIRVLKVVRKISEQKAELIYPYFEEIVFWLRQPNSFIKWDGILCLSNLAAVDREDKFTAIYRDYFGLIRDPQMITAANVIGNAWKIVLARPEWELDITARLLEVPDITYLNDGEPSPEVHLYRLQGCDRVFRSVF